MNDCSGERRRMAVGDGWDGANRIWCDNRNTWESRLVAAI